MVELRVRVVLPDPPEVRVTLVGLRDAVRPEGEALDASVTVPAKPLTLVRFSLAVLVRPVTTFSVAGAVTEKSTTLTGTVTEREREPLTP